VVAEDRQDGKAAQKGAPAQALLQVRDVVARVKGVGDVRLFGIREYSMRACVSG